MLVLGSTLLAAAGLSILLMAPLLFETPPPALARGRPLVLISAGIAALLILLEWLGVH